MTDYASDESDLDSDFDSSKNPESADTNDTPTCESSSDDEPTDNDSCAIATEEEPSASVTRPPRIRQPVQRYETTSPRSPRSQTLSEVMWHTDPKYKKERLSWIGKEVNKFFPTHGIFKGKFQQYHYASDKYTITCQEKGVERVTYVRQHETYSTGHSRIH
jgi:hypothetical protein